MQNPAVPFMPIMPRLLPNRDMAIFPAWAHPELRYWADTYLKIRDCMAGEQEVKQKAETYLPRMAEMDQDEYQAYLDRAVFFNMTNRTISALVGTVFQRPPKVEGLPARLKDAFQSVVYNNVSFETFTTEVLEAQISMGRYGILLDRDSKGQNPPYLRGYEAENIIDWRMQEVNGRMQPIQIVLREFHEVNSRKIGQVRRYVVVYRILSLDFPQPEMEGVIPTYEPLAVEGVEPVYRQYIYVAESITADLTSLTPIVVTPTNRGVPFDFIPFWFAGARDNSPSVDRPPASDIASLNLAHYRAYAHLEHGRFFCAMPVYYVQVMPTNEKVEYTLGPSRVWEVAQGEKPGILEFHGAGLQTLENSCNQKEDQIAAIGGRLMQGASKNSSESDNQAKIKETNERSLLLKVIQNAGEALEASLNVWAKWQDVENPQIGVDLNAAFIFNNLGARELRAAHQMYVEGVIPVTALHNYLLKAELIPDWMDVETFKKLLSKVDEFPNQPDVWAKQMGFDTMADRRSYLLDQRETAIQDRQTEINQQLADQDKIDIEGNLDIKQQQVDVQQQLADQQGQMQESQQKLAQEQHKLQKQQIKNGKPAIPAQVQGARAFAQQSKQPPAGGGTNGGGQGAK